MPILAMTLFAYPSPKILLLRMRVKRFPYPSFPENMIRLVLDWWALWVLCPNVQSIPISEAPKDMLSQVEIVVVIIVLLGFQQTIPTPAPIAGLMLLHRLGKLFRSQIISIHSLPSCRHILPSPRLSHLRACFLASAGS